MSLAVLLLPRGGLAGDSPSFWSSVPGLERSSLIVNRWEPLKHDGNEEYRVFESDIYLHLPVGQWALRAPDARVGWRIPVWLTLHVDARVLDVPTAPVEPPTYNPSINLGVFRDLGGWQAGVAGRLAHESNGADGPSLNPPAELARPGVGPFNEHDGRFSTDNWRVTLVVRSVRGDVEMGRTTAGAEPVSRVPASVLTASEAYQREIFGSDQAVFGPLGPEFRAWYPAARSLTEVQWDVFGPAGRLSLRGRLTVTFEGAYASLRQHYANSLVEATGYPWFVSGVSRSLGLFIRAQWGLDEYNIMFTTKVHEIVAGLSWDFSRFELDGPTGS